MKSLVLLSLSIALFAAPAFARTPNTLQTFAVLGASTVTNTGPTQITGNLGVGPGTAVVGFPPGIMETGTIHVADAMSMEAQAELTTAYNAAAGMPCNSNLTGQDLGGLTLTPGVYCFDTSAQLTGPLVLDFQSSPKASFVFQIGSTLTTASSSNVSVTNCTQHCLVAWQVGSSATLGTSSKFVGDIMAESSITLTTEVNICGRALARTGAVTMDTDIVNFMGNLNPLSTITGRGQIPVPAPDSSDPAATGAGNASFAFIDGPTGKGGFFSYRNDVTGLRAYGSIDEVEVLSTRQDGSPKTVRISGACHSSLAPCSFSAIVEKPEDPGGSLQFGVTIAGGLAEARSPRAASAGQVQFR
ncbi:MAG: ice-binding family protein [Bryobacteraceae bacterium]|jgi:hypothetical protein